MIDPESELLDDEYLSLKVFPKYIVFETKFTVIFSMEIENKNDVDLFLMLPKISEDKEIEINNRSIFNGISKLPPFKTETYDLEVEVSLENLLKFGPIKLSFFACFEDELGVVFSKNDIETNVWKKNIVLPVNILKFVNSINSPDFSKLSGMKISQELLVNNQSLLLTDISIMFPNLSKIFL